MLREVSVLQPPGPVFSRRGVILAEGVHSRSVYLEGSDSGRGSVLQQAGHKVDCLGTGPGTEHLDKEQIKLAGSNLLKNN